MRRLVASLAVLVVALAATPAQAQRRAPVAAAPVAATAPAGTLVHLGGLLGFESVDLSTGVALRADAEFALQRLAPMVSLSIVGSLGLSFFSDDGGYSNPFYVYDNYAWEQSITVLKIIPAARFTFGRSARFRPYADAGLGLYYASASLTESGYYQSPYYPYDYIAYEDEYSDSTTGAVLRLAGGINFQVSPVFSLGGELGFTPYLGDMEGSGFNAMFSAQFRL